MEMDKQAQQLFELATTHGTPLYAYDLAYLEQRALGLLKLCQSRSYTLRYAVKANPHPAVINLFDGLGLSFDASSEFEAIHLQKLKISSTKISLSSQQPPTDMAATLGAGVKFVATSLNQLNLVSSSGYESDLGVRLNPGIGVGGTNRTTTGGTTASFGIWHEHIPEVIKWQKTSGCLINRIHVHIGSGGDPRLWSDIIKRSLGLVKMLPSVTSLNIGGGFRVARMPGEVEADMEKIVKVFEAQLAKFHKISGRSIDLELEPGTWLVANGGYLLAKIIDIVDTGPRGFNFIKLDTGMNDFLRPAIYGAQHPIEVLNDNPARERYVVVGHNCESGDILTPAPNNPEQIQPRLLKRATIGDLVIVSGAGAYGASMRAIGYNSFPSAKEVTFSD